MGSGFRDFDMIVTKKHIFSTQNYQNFLHFKLDDLYKGGKFWGIGKKVYKIANKKFRFGKMAVRGGGG